MGLLDHTADARRQHDTLLEIPLELAVQVERSATVKEIPCIGHLVAFTLGHHRSNAIGNLVPENP